MSCQCENYRLNLLVSDKRFALAWSSNVQSRRNNRDQETGEEDEGSLPADPAEKFLSASR